MSDFIVKRDSLAKYKGNATKAIIPYIRADYLPCMSPRKLTHTVIPSSMTGTSFLAFRGCLSLTEVSIPKSVTSIGEHAFYARRGLTRLEIPDSVYDHGVS